MKALTVLRGAIARLTPIDVAMSRGLGAKEIERLWEALVFVEGHLTSIEIELEDAELAAELATEDADVEGAP
jgi:hypothetical protein